MRRGQRSLFKAWVVGMQPRRARIVQDPMPALLLQQHPDLQRDAHPTKQTMDRQACPALHSVPGPPSYPARHQEEWLKHIRHTAETNALILLKAVPIVPVSDVQAW
ncbi:MAG: hypothetical protein EBS37_12415 [Betaproteobacteria bacterium]|nr:hypothetical protein [Betaproteobacteria bacterium]NBU44868.1 hypothetical protein [Betaproteobacteria bacterium]